MSDMVQIRSVKQYFNDFIVANLKGKEKVDQTDLIPIKEAILKEFKNEVFGQIYFKLGDEAKTMTRDDLAKIDAVHNILHQEVRKWKRFCVLCSEYGLGTFFGLRDLERILTEEEKEDDPDEIVYEEVDTTVENDPFEEDVTDQLDGEPVAYLNGGLTVDDQSAQQVM